jgi:hypothetical protein
MGSEKKAATHLYGQFEAWQGCVHGRHEAAQKQHVDGYVLPNARALHLYGHLLPRAPQPRLVYLPHSTGHSPVCDIQLSQKYHDLPVHTSGCPDDARDVKQSRGRTGCTGLAQVGLCTPRRRIAVCSHESHRSVDICGWGLSRGVKYLSGDPTKIMLRD